MDEVPACAEFHMWRPPDLPNYRVRTCAVTGRNKNTIHKRRLLSFQVLYERILRSVTENA